MERVAKQINCWDDKLLSRADSVRENQAVKENKGDIGLVVKSFRFIPEKQSLHELFWGLFKLYIVSKVLHLEEYFRRL